MRLNACDEYKPKVMYPYYFQYLDRDLVVSEIHMCHTQKESKGRLHSSQLNTNLFAYDDHPK